MVKKSGRKPRQDGDPIIIKKYANRRLYNTDSSSYVTLDDLAQMVKDNNHFIVKDAKSGRDITHSVLTQIIFEEESKGETLLPANFLRQLISFYGDGLQKIVPGYLENSLTIFSKNQEKIRSFVKDNMQNSVVEMKSMKPFEEMVKQNMAIFEQTMSMFSPFGASRGAKNDESEREQMAAKPSTNHSESARSHQGSDAGVDKTQLADLQTQLARMQEQINRLQKK